MVRGGLLAVAFVLLVVTMPLAAGQAANNSTNATAGNDTAANATAGNATGANSSVGANGSGGGGMFGFDPVGAFMDMLSGLADAFLGIGEGTVEALNDIVFSIPAPGTLDDPSSWASPDDGIWRGVVDALPLTTIVWLPLYVFAMATTFAESDDRARRQGYKRLAVAAFMILTMLAVPALILHTTNAIAEALAPSGTEFFSTPGSASKLGAGLGIGVILAIFNSASVGIALVVVAMEQVLIYVTVYLWLCGWAAYANSVGIIRSLGQTVIYTFSVVVAMKVVQALIARFLFTLPLDGDGFTPLIALLIILGGVLFTFIFFPKSMLDHANDAASVSLGVSGAEKKGGEWAERSAGRVREEVMGRYQSYRSTDDASEDRSGGGSMGGIHSSSAKNVGQVQAGSVQVRSGSMSQAGGNVPDRSGDDVGIDAGDWEQQREHMRQDTDRMFQ